jgi:hypothetical protein
VATLGLLELSFSMFYTSNAMVFTTIAQSSEINYWRLFLSRRFCRHDVQRFFSHVVAFLVVRCRVEVFIALQTNAYCDSILSVPVDAVKAFGPVNP